MTFMPLLPRLEKLYCAVELGIAARIVIIIRNLYLDVGSEAAVGDGVPFRGEPARNRDLERGVAGYAKDLLDGTPAEGARAHESRLALLFEGPGKDLGRRG